MNSTGSGAPRRWIGALPAILGVFIALVIFSSYSNTFSSPPYLDDFHSFINVRAFYPHSISFSEITALSRTQFGWARFLPDLTFALNNYLGGSLLVYFHAVNILIHMLAFFAFLWFARLTLAAGEFQSALPVSNNQDSPADRSESTKAGETPGLLWHSDDDGAGNNIFFGLLSVCIAAIWAVSPVQTSAVTYLVQRMASMQALFFTLSAACFIKARFLSRPRLEAASERTISVAKRRKATVFYFLCVLSGLCAALSKENSAMLPVVLAVIDIWFFDSAWVKKAVGLFHKTGWKLRVFASVALVSLFYYFFYQKLFTIFSQYDTRNFTMGERLLTEARVVVWYMSLLLWPAPSRLSMQHDPRISTSFFHPLTTFPAILFICVLFLLAVRFRKSFAVITFGIIWFFLNLIIESTVIPLELVFEHRLYLPSMGFYLAVVTLFAFLLRKAARRMPGAEFAKALFSLLLVCVSLFAIMTFLRNNVWKDTISIHLDTVEKAPDNARANADYASNLFVLGQHEEGLKYANRALELAKTGVEYDGLAQNVVILALKQEGKRAAAVERATKFLQADVAKSVNMDFLPCLCGNVARICLSESKPKEAYKWALTSLMFTQASAPGSFYKVHFAEWVLVRLFSRYNLVEIDPTLAASLAPYLPARYLTAGEKGTTCSLPEAKNEVLGLKAPGVCSVSARPPASVNPGVLAAIVLDAHGEEGYARMILQREFQKNPADPLIKAELAKLAEEDAKNLVQRKCWNVFDNYEWHPFSWFNFNMAVAYLVQTHQPKFFLRIGENRLDAALRMAPENPDARLLKAWYLFGQNKAAKAAMEVQKLLAANPQNSKLWLASGFFLAQAGDKNGAEAALKKVVELYPGYPHRYFVQDFRSRLRTGKSILAAAVQ